MRGIKNFLCWMFALSAATCLWFISLIWPVRAGKVATTTTVILVDAALVAMSIIFAMAWWSIWRRKPSASVWGIAASMSYVVLAVDGFLTHTRDSGIPLVAGLAGILAFWPHKEQVAK